MKKYKFTSRGGKLILILKKEDTVNDKCINKLCFLIFACKLTVSKNLFQILNDLFFTREN